MTINSDEIQKYFDEYIFGFIFQDIQSCIQAQTNYTTALALLSYTEFLGGLINGTLGLRDRSREQFNKALEFFDWNEDLAYYRNFKVKIREVDFLDVSADIYSLFRCGLAHEYFIKTNAYVHNNPQGFTDGNGIIYPDGCLPTDAGVQKIDGRLRFHNNAYFRDFKKAWRKYLHALIIEKNKNLVLKYSNSLQRVAVRRLI